MVVAAHHSQRGESQSRAKTNEASVSKKDQQPSCEVRKVRPKIGELNEEATEIDLFPLLRQIEAEALRIRLPKMNVERAPEQGDHNDDCQTRNPNDKPSPRRREPTL